MINAAPGAEPSLTINEGKKQISMKASAEGFRQLIRTQQAMYLNGCECTVLAEVIPDNI